MTSIKEVINKSKNKLIQEESIPILEYIIANTPYRAITMGGAYSTLLKIDIPNVLKNIIPGK